MSFLTASKLTSVSVIFNSFDSLVHMPISASMAQDDCEICRQLWRLFVEPDCQESINLGSFKDAAATTCPGHGPLVKAFVAHCEGSERESTDVGFSKMGAGSPVELIQSLKHLGMVWSLLLVKKDNDPSHPGTGRILNPEWADLDTVVEWKNTCLTTHGETCKNPIKIPKTQPDFLIDVPRRCVVNGSDVQGNYVALSYAWGMHGKSTTDMPFTRVELFEPGALDRPEVQEHLAPIIGHAMQLTDRIGEHYLWVDALCIDHNDQEHAARELQAMSAIYSNALVTIVSADGDSQAGIPGLQGISSARDMQQKVFPFGKQQVSVRNTGIFFMSLRSERYFNRGWTYQEHKLPSRSLIFVQNEVHWQCQCSVWHEELKLHTETEKYIDPRLRVILAGFPDLNSLFHMIGGYNTMNLTFEEDALPAISGLLSIMSRSFTGGFLFGLPEMYFEQCLAWRPYWHHTDLKRRISSDRSAADKLAPCDLPSWSWIGWQGPVGVHADAARINPRESRIQETVPITEWYCGQSPTDEPWKRRRIRSTWYEERASRKVFTKPLPPGWTRHDMSTRASFRDEPALYPDGCGDYVFRHPAMCDPDSVINDWYYPFPVADIQPSTPTFTPEQWPYLFCKTKSVRVLALKTDKDNIREKNVVHFGTASGEHCGYLHLHNDEQLALFPEEQPGKEVELVALCRAKTYEKTWKEEEQKYDLPINVAERMNVLWIEWEDGVAYRRASGVVFRESELEWKDVDLVLG